MQPYLIRFPMRVAFAVLALALSAVSPNLARGSSDNLTPSSMHPCWEYEAVPWFPQAQYTEKFNTCFVLVGVAKIDLRANPREAWGTLEAKEACAFESLAHANSVSFQVDQTYRWKCAGKGEVEGDNVFARTGFVHFVKNDAGYAIDNWIHLKTTAVDYTSSLQQAATAASGPMGSPPSSSLGGSASFSYGGAQFQLGFGSGQPRPLSFEDPLNTPAITVWEYPVCVTKYDRQIRTHSKLSGWVDGSPFSPAQLAMEVRSTMESSFHLLPCPEKEE